LLTAAAATRAKPDRGGERYLLHRKGTVTGVDYARARDIKTRYTALAPDRFKGICRY
jgi:hypothetical protein